MSQLSRTSILALFLSQLAAWPASGASLGPTATIEDYQAAAAVLPTALNDKLRNLRVIPHWIGHKDWFWYRRETRTGFEFVRVDAATGNKQPAFDHSALAAALSVTSGKPVDLKKLPFDSFDYEAGEAAIGFSIESKSYRCTLIPARCNLRESAAADPGALLAPNGRQAVLSRDGNLWLRDLRTGSEHALTQDGEANFGYGIWHDAWKSAYIPRERAGKALAPLESYWSPDSRRVIVSRMDQRHVAPYPLIESVPFDGSFRPRLHSVRMPLVGEKAATLEWFVFDIPSGKHRRIEFPYSKLLVMQADLMPIRKTWFSRDNRHLYAVAFGENMESAYLFDANLDSGQVRTVIEEHAKPRMDLNSTSYNGPNVEVLGGGHEVIWFSQRDGWGHLYLYDGVSGKLKNRITQGDWLVRDIIHVDEKNRRVYFTAGGREPGNPYYRYLYRVGFDGSDLKLLTPEPADHLLTNPANIWPLDGALGYEPLSPSGAYIVYSHSPIDQAGAAHVRAVSDGRLVATFEQADISDALAAGFRPPQEFVAKAADGKTDLYCVIYRPLHFDPAKKYPVVDAQYASPLTAVVPRNLVQAVPGPVGYGSAAATAQLGFIVVAVDARGTTFRSRDFINASYGRLATMGLEDHIAAIRQLAAQDSSLDLDRVGITGLSYGGWTVLRGLFEFPEFFKVGVAGVPPGSMHNMYLDYHWTAFQGRPAYSDGSETRPNPTEVPSNWQSVDARSAVDKLSGKLLIVMGELDENVLPGSELQLVDALMAKNKDFDLLYLPDTNHAGSANSYVVRRMWDYLVRNLQHVEPPPQFKIAGPDQLGF